MVEVSKDGRNQLSHHEQMIDAQSGCLPCKLCGGKALVTDAGTGAGYYIECENGSDRNGRGCLINERRVSGWAYNVMDWWNRLHSTATLQAERDRYRAALEQIAAFTPKSAAGSKIEQVLQNEWNRAGEYAATIARTALSDTPTVQS